MNFKEEEVGNMLEFIGTGKNLLNRSLIVQALRLAIYNWLSGASRSQKASIWQRTPSFE